MLVDDVRRFDIFADLEAIEVKKLLQFAQVRQFNPKEVIFKQGDPGSGLFLIIKGEIEIYVEPSGNRVSLALLKAGEFMGEMSLFGDGQQTRTASAMAEGNVVAVIISTVDFRRLQQSGPKILSKLLLRLLMSLSTRYRNLKTELRTLMKEIEAEA
jgi:CRP-like cAMP-binding protein